IRESMAHIPGIVTAVEQPIAHLISHMLSGVKAQIGIKIYGDDLDVLRKQAEAMRVEMELVPGVKDLMIEPQVIIPQLRIELDRDKLLLYGLTASDVNEFIATAMNGDVVSEVLVGQRTSDLLVRLEEGYREDIHALQRLSIDLPAGGRVPLSAVARVYESGGPNTVNREHVRRRIVIQCNVTGRGVVDVVRDIQQIVQPVVTALPSGYFVEYGGQFESQQSASRVIGLLFLVSLVGVFLVLYTMFRSVNLSLQVMAALPMAFIGSVAALFVTGQTLTIAAMVGFISLAGIASRNGILLLNHYLHLVQYEGEEFTPSMIVRAGLERLAPVLMTALTSGIGLVPLVLAAGEPGKEILYPVATVILGGLISSTLLDFFVHPALFWMFGMRAAQRVVNESASEVPLVESGHEIAN
ncbi:efflux RND transporter permease subunit, partial [Candidatus Woesebacteria bacterium]|nr:efflux RND transporter permease subunit [Candidatus Woesebacteria bacterium]